MEERVPDDFSDLSRDELEHNARNYRHQYELMQAVKERRKPDGITWKVVAIGLLAVTPVAFGASWRAMDLRVTNVEADQKQDKDERAKQATDIAVIKEKVKGLETSQQEIKTDLRDQGKKLDEILRRVR